MKTDRLVAIIMTLLSREAISAAELAEMFEVSLRTIYRDIDALGRAGVPVSTAPGPGGGISMMSSYKVNKRFFTDEEINAMLIGLNSLHAIPNTQTMHTMAKVRGMLHVDAKQKADLIKLDYTPWHNNTKIPDFFDQLLAAIEQKQLIRFAYGDKHQQSSLRDVEPLRLLLKGQDWYLQGYCRMRKAYRTFKLLRMREITILDEHFQPQPLAYSELDKIVDFNETLEEVSLRMHHSLLEEAATCFRGEMSAEPDDGEYYIVKGLMPIYDSTCRYILSLGEKCECLAPENMRQRIKQIAAAIVEVYS
jgi:predicted DNA-binding transcriptional regulator YafY